MNIFLGITGASGGPYAARLLDALLAADVEVGLCISRAGYEILATELYQDISLSHEQILDRFVEGKQGVIVHSEQDWRAPYASGSARVDGYVVCPCSMGTAGTIAAGTMSNLIHRAASVALKEGRKLVLVPRETPLSDIHLENLLRLRRAGAVVLMAAPCFYNTPQTVDDLIEFVVGRCLDQLGIENKLTRRWGQE
jgi:flavin prenyltransferase